MPKKATARRGRYLYAVQAGVDELNYGALGINGGKVYTISNGQVSAVVSNIPNKKIRPERRNLQAHQEVLKRLMEENTVLPISFGIIADSSRAIQKILNQNREALLDQLNRVSGKVEMGLRVKWDVPNIFEYFVNTHQELRRARDRLLGGPREPAPENKIELGRMFDRILNEDRDVYTEKVEEVLSKYCFEIKRKKCRNEKEVMNLACLVAREALKEFETGIFEAAKLFDNSFAFDYNGPWAPHNFAEINLKL